MEISERKEEIIVEFDLDKEYVSVKEALEDNGYEYHGDATDINKKIFKKGHDLFTLDNVSEFGKLFNATITKTSVSEIFQYGFAPYNGQ